MGSDGTLGLKSIKENLGMVMVQDPASAKYDSMPLSAINTGMADYIAAAQELPAKLVQYFTHAPAAREKHVPAEGNQLLRSKRSLFFCVPTPGFSCYKNSTVGRRIERRMSVHQFDGLPRYVRFLQENPQEVELLYKELLIGVANFFRDPGLSIVALIGTAA
jgi:two-component system CheB/CheR fusion protein